MATKAQAKKALDRAKLKDTDVVWIGIAATEFNMQRLAALLLFAEHPIRVEAEPTALLPWEDPNDPRFEKPPELQIDYELVRRTITKHLTAYLAKHGEEKARAVLKSFGAERISLVAQDQLVPMNAALEAALAE